VTIATVDFRLLDCIADTFFQVPHCDDDTVPDRAMIQDTLAEHCVVAMGLDWVNQFKNVSEAAAMILALRLLKQIEVN